MVPNNYDLSQRTIYSVPATGRLSDAGLVAREGVPSTAGASQPPGAAQHRLSHRHQICARPDHQNNTGNVVGSCRYNSYATVLPTMSNTSALKYYYKSDCI